MSEKKIPIGTNFQETKYVGRIFSVCAYTMRQFVHKKFFESKLPRFSPLTYTEKNRPAQRCIPFNMTL